MNYIIAGAAMAASNFMYQAANHHDFMTAFERSWFQICALMVAWLIAFLVQRSPQASEAPHE
jgi:meiotically up-regulated gene 157 (Mug157) protein